MPSGFARLQSNGRRRSAGSDSGSTNESVDEVEQAQRRGGEERRARAEPAQQSADRRAEDEADAERGADHAEVLRAPLAAG